MQFRVYRVPERCDSGAHIPDRLPGGNALYCPEGMVASVEDDETPVAVGAVHEIDESPTGVLRKSRVLAAIECHEMSYLCPAGGLVELFPGEKRIQDGEFSTLFRLRPEGISASGEEETGCSGDVRLWKRFLSGEMRRGTSEKTQRFDAAEGKTPWPDGTSGKEPLQMPEGGEDIPQVLGEGFSPEGGLGPGGAVLSESHTIPAQATCLHETGSNVPFQEKPGHISVFVSFRHVRASVNTVEQKDERPGEIGAGGMQQHSFVSERTLDVHGFRIHEMASLPCHGRCPLRVDTFPKINLPLSGGYGSARRKHARHCGNSFSGHTPAGIFPDRPRSKPVVRTVFRSKIPRFLLAEQ